MLKAVSILVLLDFLFGQAITSGMDSAASCFNPCFAGFPFWTGNVLIVFGLPAYRFNPCFAGFPFWTFRVGLISLWLYRFNPCFAGFPFWTSEFYLIYPNQSGFQSLFCWISFLDYQAPNSYIEHSPHVSILVLLDFLFGLDFLRFDRCRLHEFQSLFCWISFLD